MVRWEGREETWIGEIWEEGVEKRERACFALVHVLLRL